VTRQPARAAPGRFLSRPVPARPASTLRERRLVELGIVVVAFVWGSNFIVVKALIEHIPPLGLSAMRFTLASVVLFVLLRVREGSIGVPRRDLLPMALLGVLGFGLYQTLWTLGLVSIPAGDSALLIAFTPILTALLAVVAGSDTLTRPKLLGAIISFVGVAIIVAGEGLSLGSSLLGDVLTLCAAGCWAIYTAFGAPILRRHSPLRTTTWTMAAGALFLVVPGTAQLAAVDWSLIGAGVWLAFLYSSLQTSLANVVVFQGVKLLGPTRVTAYQFLIPLFAVILAALILAEPIRPNQVLGGIVIVAGILVTRTGRRIAARWAGRPVGP
jgi:drug/metabolite transporter (DMT)-like permease